MGRLTGESSLAIPADPGEGAGPVRLIGQHQADRGQAKPTGLWKRRQGWSCSGG
jgi:hypothetical protein